MIDFQVFIASSLALEEYRDAVAQAIQDINEREIKCSFSVFDYNKSTNIIQRQEPKSAQEPINKKIEESAFFILIIDGTVGDKTIEEYIIASQLCRNHRYPAFISIFYKENSTAINNGRMSFDDFIKNYIKNARFDEKQHLVADDIIYPYPFKTKEDIREKVRFEIIKWLDSPYRPLIDAKMGNAFTAEDFYTDKVRRDNCILGMYFHRKFDKKLIKELEGQHDIVYLYGSSLSGKTRAVFQAVSKIPNSWFYVFHNDEKLKKQIRDVTDYLSRAALEQKLYLIFDDFDKYGLNHENGLNDLFNQLFQQLRNKSCTVIITTSVPLRDFDIFEGLDLVDINIPQMKQVEYMEAIQLFGRYGIKIDSQNTMYRTTGALLINLDDLKGRYTNYLNENNGYYERMVRKNLLRSIKAFSIWHKTNIGDLDGLFDFCNYLIQEERDSEGRPLKVSRGFFNDAVKQLSKRCAGISTDYDQLPKSIESKEKLVIQEYVYSFFISCTGDIYTSNNKESVDSPNMCHQKLELIYLILSYVYKHGESLIIDFAKIIVRCGKNEKVIEHLFGLWQGTVNPLQENNEWVVSLREEREAIERGEGLDKYTEDLSLVYSRIFKRMIYNADNFDQALEYYNMAKEGLRDQFMLGAMIVRASDNEQMNKIEGLIEFEKYKNESSVLCKRLMKHKTFAGGFKIFKEFEKPDINLYLQSLSYNFESLDKENAEKYFMVQFNVEYYRTSLSRLFSLISTEEELEKGLELLRENYIYCTNSQEVLEYCKMNSEVPLLKKLTIIDLLGTMNLHILLKAFKYLFRTDIEQMESFLVDKLLSVIPLTQENGIGVEVKQGFTPRYRIRMIITTIANAFIDSLRECNYETVYKQIFIRLEDEKSKLIFRDSYTYSLMLDIKNGTIWDGMNLFYHYMEPHSRDSQNFFFINLYILNRLLEKAKMKDSALVLIVNKLFDDYNVQRDHYTYNQLLEYMPYKEGLKILKIMLQQKVQTDRFTYCNLVKSAKGIPQALAFFNWRDMNLPPELIVQNQISDDQELMELLKNEEALKGVPKEQYSWLCLLGKYCRNETERKVIDCCLSYLEKKEELSFLLDNKGSLYNICIKNRTYIRTYDELTTFMKRHPKFVFDSYSLKHSIEVLLHEDTPRTHNRVINDVNELFLFAHKQKIQITKEYYNLRIGFFTSHREETVHLFVFFNEEGQAVEEKCKTPLHYIQCMVDYGITVDRETIQAVIKIKGFRSNLLLDNILDFCEKHHIPIDAKLRTFIFNEFETLILLGTRERLMSMVTNSDPNLYNEQLVSDFKNDYITFEKAVDSVDRLNLVSSSIAYNNLLSCLHQKNREKKGICSGVKQESFFRMALDNVYKKYILKYSRPDENTFSILAKMITSFDEFRELKKELESFNLEHNSSLKMTDSMLITMLNLAQGVHQLREYVQAYINAGCDLPTSCADVMLRSLVRISETNDKCAIHNVENIAKYIIFRDEIFLKELDNLFVFDHYRMEKTVTAITIINLLNYSNISQCVSMEDIMRSVVQFYPYLLKDPNGLVEFLGKWKKKVEWNIPFFKVLNESNEQNVVMFRSNLLCRLINYHIFSGKIWKMDYDEYRTIVNFWTDGKYNLEHSEAWNHMAVSIALLIVRLCESKRKDNPFRGVLDRFCQAVCDDNLTVNSYLLCEDDKQDVIQFELIDNCVESMFVFNAILLYQIRHLPNENFSSKDKKVIEIISQFLEKHSLYYKTFKEICFKHIKIFANYYSLIPLISDSQECMLVLLTCMASKAEGYEKIVQIITVILQYNIDLREELMSNIAQKIATDSSFDKRSKKVFEQILGGLRNDELYAYHFLEGDDALIPNLNRPVTLHPDVRMKLLMSHRVRNCSIPQDACGQILNYCRTIVKDLEEHDKYRKDSFIDTMLVNSLIFMYVRLCSKENINIEERRKEEWIKMIKLIYRVSPEKKVDVSPLFMNPKYIDGLNQLGINLLIPQRYLDYTIIHFLDIPIKEKIDLIIGANLLYIWLRSFEKSEDILNLLPYVKERSPIDVKWVFKAALEKTTELETFKKLLMRLDLNEECLDDNSCVWALFQRFIYFIHINYNLYISLSGVRLPLPHACEYRVFNKIFRGLNLKSTKKIEMSVFHANEYKKLLAENRLMGEIVNMNDLSKIYAEVKKYVNKNRRVETDFVTIKLLAVNDVRIQIIQDICMHGEFKLSYLARLGVEEGDFDVKMSSEILKSLFSALDSNGGTGGISRLDLFCAVLKLFGSSCLEEYSLQQVIVSLQNVEDYRLFLEEAHIRELKLTARHLEVLAGNLRKWFKAADYQKNELLWQTYSRVATYSETDSLMYQHFLLCDVENLPKDEWGDTCVKKDNICKVIGIRTLKEKICCDMYKLPDQYLRSLMIMREFIRNNSRERVKEEVIRKIYSYEAYWGRIMTYDKTCLEDLQLIPLYWKDIDWKPKREFVLALINYYMQFLGSSEKIADEKDQELIQSTIKNLYACLLKAQISKFSQVKIKFSDLSERVESTCDSCVLLPIEKLDTLFNKIYNNGQSRK